MRTEVIMERVFSGGVVRQKSQTEFLCATDFIKEANKHRFLSDKPIFNLTSWLNQKTTQEFIEELKSSVVDKPFTRSKKKGVGTWMHPFLFIDLALAVDPELKVKVYKWLYDNLLQYRNSSGDSYKKMCGAIISQLVDKRTFPKRIINVATNIKNACKVSNWQEATEQQLELRDKIQDNISLLADVLTDVDKAVEIGIDKAINNL